MSEKIGQQFVISGRVQGVFYRRFAKQQAIALGITGWARNLPDGAVEVHAFGTSEQLSIYQAKLWKGPVTAKVIDVVSSSIALELCTSFRIVE